MIYALKEHGVNTYGLRHLIGFTSMKKRQAYVACYRGPLRLEVAGAYSKEADFTADAKALWPGKMLSIRKPQAGSISRLDVGVFIYAKAL